MLNRVAIISLAVCLTAGAAFADDLRVPQDHATIQAAVDAAGDGDVIIVKGGKYAEDVQVTNKTNLTITGKGSVTLMPTDRGILATGCTNLTISKIKCKGGNTGFEFFTCAGVTLEKFSVKGASLDGVYATSSSDVRILKGKVSTVGRDGVAFSDEDEANPIQRGEVTQVSVKDCGEDGIDILGSNVTVSRCTTKNAADDGFESDDGGVGPVTFDRCKSINSGDEGFELYCPNTTATNCKTIRAGDGFDARGDDSRVENCKAIRTRFVSFEVQDGTRITILNCKSIRSGDDAFVVVNASNNVIDGCTSIRAAFDGFYIDSDSSNNVIRNCKATTSRDDDLDDEGTNNTTTENNKFKKIEDNG